MLKLRNDLAGADATDATALRRIASRHADTARNSRIVDAGDLAARRKP